WRVLKPGGHLLAFAGTRTQHRMAVNIEDAGFEIRDMIAWVYGSGFPKSLDVSKAIDAKLTTGRSDSVGLRVRDGREAGAVGTNMTKHRSGRNDNDEGVGSAPIQTDAAKQWAGWGTALKPALEPITVARKPLIGTVAENVLQHGTGAINVDGCRVEGVPPSVPQPAFNSPTGRTYGMKTGEGRNGEMSHAQGRWPANLIHDGSDEVVGLFPVTPSGQLSTKSKASGWHGDAGKVEWSGASGDSGSAARFFYTAKAAKRERQGVTHPTVKPLDLMAYLCRLVTPPGGIVLDPFMGTGTTIKAAMSEGFHGIGIERDPAYFAMAEHRLNGAQLGLGLELPT
ncbi:MAG: site-specific DNA-methyltransferase, partial [Cyanobacteria bacterium K_Offshore_surface_m2_239]|nr:site-specific DNA-methyltransferase [Cyanobacteria bacterium K_Offshore_surface_m2_239]